MKALMMTLMVMNVGLADRLVTNSFICVFEEQNTNDQTSPRSPVCSSCSIQSPSQYFSVRCARFLQTE